MYLIQTVKVHKINKTTKVIIVTMKKDSKRKEMKSTD